MAQNFQKDLLEEFPEYINEIEFPTEYQDKFSLFGLVNNTFTLSEMQIDPIKVDYKSASFDFVQYDYDTVIMMKFPLIKNWNFNTKYSLDWTIMSWIFPKEGEFYLS